MEPKLPAKWLSLLGKLWASDEKTIGDFLREIVALIKTTNHSFAEIGLYTIMHSPKVRDCSRNSRLLTPGIVTPFPDYRTIKLYADVAGLPIEEVRKKAIANLKQAGKEDGIAKALTMEDAVKIFEEFEKKTDEPAKRTRRARKKKNEKGEEKDEASAKRAQRARKLLGIPRKSGRPNTGQK